jgi:glutathione S-transferase
MPLLIAKQLRMRGSAQEGNMLKLYGAGPSPFVRKARVVLAEKNIPYENDPIIPFNVSPEYKKISPLGKIPAIDDGGKILADSSVICAYLERKHPNPRLYPEDPYEYGRALWFEEYADTAVVEIIGPKIFFQRIIQPRFFNQPADEAMVKKALEEDLPIRLDYLESQLDGGEGIVGGRFTIADIALGSQFVNALHSDVKVDGKRWPKVATYVERIHARPSFQKLIEEERAFLGVA